MTVLYLPADESLHVRQNFIWKKPNLPHPQLLATPSIYPNSPVAVYSKLPEGHDTNNNEHQVFTIFT